MIRRFILNITSCFRSKAEYIYVLKLESGKWYIGRSKNVQERIREHQNNNGSEFTKLFKIIKLEKSFKVKSIFDEDNTVKLLMMKYGVENVRGGTYSKLILEDSVKSFLIAEFRHANNQCLKCGSLDHYIKECEMTIYDKEKSSFKNIYVIKFGKHKNKTIEHIPKSYIQWCKSRQNPTKDMIEFLDAVSKSEQL
jgi:hypothetical protein